ncbi:Txe/YoeB family addiction module toxin [Cyclobacterium jeungdonense]|uniref:Txe/YoeB family addiction module toxin n=1 Tax=Cyclobacterium jeungdonense TaxID=708087 RepID=UPI0013D45BD2
MIYDLSEKINLKNTSIGKPEPLKYNYSGFWFRSINGEHRLIYQVKADEILIAKCRFHYD